MRSTTTPENVLDYWIGGSAESASAIADMQPRWFQKSFETDKQIADNFIDVLADLASGKANEWARQGARPRLAAIIVLDQFSRNLFRGHKLSFAHDAIARNLMKTGLALGEDKQLSETERVFFYLPAEHSEDMLDQKLSVRLFKQLVAEARPEFKDFCASTLDYAKAHFEVVDEYGRFPHRNKVMRRTSTPEERAYLSQPGAGF
ncbi:DUF924 family protein [Henriciella sp. AS95]|uniref:DUF924 family protein n=1 Tax=Henriciella sp. AS95 TaxID=3135782 RepID=UPI003180F06C